MRPARRTTLQLPHNRLTLDRTFIIVTLNRFSATRDGPGNHSVYWEGIVLLKGHDKNYLPAERFLPNPADRGCEDALGSAAGLLTRSKTHLRIQFADRSGEHVRALVG